MITRIIFCGGGSGGPVSPLIALYQEISKRQPTAEFLWLATRRGPEKPLLASYSIPVKEIFSGKLRRYFSSRNFFDPVLIFLGFWQALFIIIQFKPKVIVSAGGFVAVPASLAAWLLGVKVIIHQQDVIPSLTNKLLAPLAKTITVSFEKSLADFPAKKTVLTGNPTRSDVVTGSRPAGLEFFKLDSTLPTILVLGGGTGAEKLNELVVAALDELVGFCQVIHLTGGKVSQTASHSRYRQFNFLTKDLALAYAVANLVVSRAGMSTLTELAVLKKPALIIPMPSSHQQANALEFFKKNAVVMMDQNQLAPHSFAAAVKQLLNDKMELETLSRNIGKMMPENSVEKIIATFL